MGNDIETAYEEREFKVLNGQGQLLFASSFVLHFTLLKGRSEGRKVNSVRAEWEESLGAGDVLHTGQSCRYYRVFQSAAGRLTCHDVTQYVRTVSVVGRQKATSSFSSSSTLRTPAGTFRPPPECSLSRTAPPRFCSTGI